MGVAWPKTRSKSVISTLIAQKAGRAGRGIWGHVQQTRAYKNSAWPKIYLVFC